MRNFNGNNRGGGGRGGNRRFGGGRDGGDRPMFNAVCGDCGRDCQVPFKPTGDRPVLCSACFGKGDGGDSRRSSDRDARSFTGSRERSNQRPDFDMQNKLDFIERKLDRIIEALNA